MVLHAALDVYQGADYASTVTINNKDGTPTDLTGVTPKAQIRRKYAYQDPIVVAEFTATVLGNVITLSLTRAITKPMSGKYVWDLKLIGSTGGVTPAAEGTVQMKPEVTVIP